MLVIAVLLLNMKIVSTFEPRMYDIISVQSDYIEFHWNILPYDVRYKIWYWPGNKTSQLRTLHTYAPYALIGNLVPGQLYNVWLMGVQHSDVTTDYIAFQQVTGTGLIPQHF